MSDRTVHAILPDKTQIVRYDKSGKWYEEQGSFRHLFLSVDEAASKVGPSAQVFYGLKGGRTFDARVRKNRALNTCFVIGSPDWWTDCSDFKCELHYGHDGAHQMTVTWDTDPEAF